MTPSLSLLLWSAAVIVAAAAWGAVAFLRIAAIGAAYKAKVIASGIFVSGREPESLLEDVSADAYRILRLFSAEVDRRGCSVKASFLGLRARTAVFRPGLGTTLAIGVPPEELAPLAARGPASRTDPGRPWPEGERACAQEAASGPLSELIRDSFGEPDGRKLRRTRAVVVVQDGRILAERYAPGFGPTTPLPGWSMAKSVLNALVGILVGEGRLSIEGRSLLPEWAGLGDPRAEISLDDLLRMRSGLQFSEVYTDPLSDVTRMLFASPSAASFAAAKLLRCRPGTLWSYSSGTSNILSRVVRLAVEKHGEDYLSYPRRALFERAGMLGAVLEPDAAGEFVCSSFLFAAARDWARFGLLYAQDGVWAGRRLLPEGWVSYSATPTPQSPGGRYGAHWWLKLTKDLGGDTAAARRIPADAFFALGHEGQTLTVIPSRRLVVVRLGLSVHVDAWDHAGFLARLLDVLP
jgi:CubicO group peptidase (beta-lactamase class C family)